MLARKKFLNKWRKSWNKSHIKSVSSKFRELNFQKDVGTICNNISGIIMQNQEATDTKQSFIIITVVLEMECVQYFKL